MPVVELLECGLWHRCTQWNLKVIWESKSFAVVLSYWKHFPCLPALSLWMKLSQNRGSGYLDGNGWQFGQLIIILLLCLFVVIGKNDMLIVNICELLAFCFAWSAWKCFWQLKIFQISQFITSIKKKQCYNIIMFYRYDKTHTGERHMQFPMKFSLTAWNFTQLIIALIIIGV